MSAYFIMAIITVAWALLLAAVGLTRDNFPPSGAGLKAILAVTLLLVGGTLVALFATTHKEHPRRHAAEEAAKKKQEAVPAPTPESSKSKAGAGSQAEQQTIKASEKEFSITIAGGDKAKAGKTTFEVANVGKIEHDLEVQGDGVEQKTPLIDPGKQAKLTVGLEPGKYRLYCTVPGHEQQGMKVDLTVR